MSFFSGIFHLIWNLLSAAVAIAALIVMWYVFEEPLNRIGKKLESFCDRNNKLR